MPSSLMKMDHIIEPKQKIYDEIGDIDDIEVMFNYVLVATYERPNKTASGIHLTDMTLKEDQYQGTVGLVVKKGPMAFENDQKVDFHGENVQIGDWVVFRASDGWKISINGKVNKHCRMLEDAHIKMKIKHPDRVY